LETAPPARTTAALKELPAMSEAAAVENQATQSATIIVNGQQKSVPSRRVTWDDVVDLAYPGQRSDPDFTFVVTYSQAEQAEHEGLLAEGGAVEVRKEGTVFDVVSRRRS
jgi:hypothetical protein